DGGEDQKREENINPHHGSPPLFAAIFSSDLAMEPRSSATAIITTAVFGSEPDLSAPALIAFLMALTLSSIVAISSSMRKVVRETHMHQKIKAEAYSKASDGHDDYRNSE